jgi:hypothetical protein
VRYDVLALVASILVSGCGGEPGVSRAEHEALLQRLDAMDRRLDALEEALATTPAPVDPMPAPPADLVDPFRSGLGTHASTKATTLALRVTITGLEIDGKPLTREDAAARFRDVARTAPGTRLMVVTEPGVPHGAVVDALDLAREAGLTEIAMSARLHGEGGAPGEGAVTAGR